MLELVVLALALAMDAVAVAATSGMNARPLRAGGAFRMAFAFGAFQAGMPCLGFAAQARFAHAVTRYTPWIAFAILVFVGGKMLKEAFAKEDEKSPRGDPFEIQILLALALATSLDALAVGVTLPFFELPLWIDVVVIGSVTFVLTLAGAYAGRAFGDRFGKRLDGVGGVVLILIGVKILAGHLLAT